jgi:hypothetical protein
LTDAIKNEGPGQSQWMGSADCCAGRRWVECRGTKLQSRIAKYFLRVVKLSSAIGYYGLAGLVDHENARLGVGVNSVFGFGAAMLRPNHLEVRTFGACPF